VTNGKAFPGIDGRSRYARRYYDLCADLARGNLSARKWRSSGKPRRSPSLQAAIVKGEPVNTDGWATTFRVVFGCRGKNDVYCLWL